MKKLKHIFVIVLSLILGVICYISSFSSAFGAKTHSYTTENGIRILKETYQEEARDFYEDSVFDVLKVFCNKPDEDEIDGAYKFHFYNPATGKNFQAEEDSALKRCKDHYSNAVMYYVNGEKTRAIEELGRAVHFLEDLNTPVHTNNQSFLDTAFNVMFHVSFENKCDEVCSKFFTSMEKPEFKYYENNTIEAIAKSQAQMANDNFYALYDHRMDKEKTAECAILNAQRAAAGMFYKFLLETNKLCQRTNL